MLTESQIQLEVAIAAYKAECARARAERLAAYKRGTSLVALDEEEEKIMKPARQALQTARTLRHQEQRRLRAEWESANMPR